MDGTVLKTFVQTYKAHGLKLAPGTVGGHGFSLYGKYLKNILFENCKYYILDI